MSWNVIILSIPTFLPVEESRAFFGHNLGAFSACVHRESGQDLVLASLVMAGFLLCV